MPVVAILENPTDIRSPKRALLHGHLVYRENLLHFPLKWTVSTA